MGKVEEVRKWISDKEELQANADPTEPPAFTSEEVPLQTKSIETTVARLSRKPKPKPVVEPKNETTSDEDEKKVDADDDEKVEEDSSEMKMKNQMKLKVKKKPLKE